MQSLIGDETVIVLLIIEFGSAGNLNLFSIFGKDVADFIEILRRVRGLMSHQIVGAVFGVAVQTVLSFVHRGKNLGGLHDIIQIVE